MLEQKAKLLEYDIFNSWLSCIIEFDDEDNDAILYKFDTNFKYLAV